MIKVVLDTSVIVKSILLPRKSLPKDIYDREIKTHNKCKQLIKFLNNEGINVYLPKVALVEVASVLKRHGYPKIALQVIESLSNSYNFVSENEIFEHSIDIALKTGASGFDCYFIATSSMLNAILITDDEKMNKHANSIGLKSILIIEKEFKEIERILKND
ncbi:PilT protein domain protein [Methanocaldococcus vulcanius M7]|uniref:PilT protein domain protein n=1 Tax=Methanocaldococcus vulcanius (strain ATCC 700851 / DSM 12094 / M7) TaxID=579137 RepID=C9RGU3_METVM|nr:type II toxin-antitoxin system VapC family toxin [Methanocaldococcus vulcanius]ACX72795.1 PilT protein domain protein [Methanocaldococcus vulcanius M7]